MHLRVESHARPPHPDPSWLSANKVTETLINFVLGFWPIGFFANILGKLLAVSC